MTTTLPQITLPPIVCTSWCSDGDGHVDDWHPADQACMSDRVDVELVAMPLLSFEGEVYARDTVGAYLVREEEGARTRLQLTHGEAPVVLMTPDEALSLASALTRLVEMAAQR